MFSPDMMKMAQEQMSKMSPEQMAAMQQQMGSMSPDMMKQAMNQMKHMSPDAMKSAQDRMKTMSADEMMQASSQASNMKSTMKAQQDYVYKASLKLKSDGNYLVGTTQYGEAVEKYTRAITNLKDIVNPDATALSTSCQLNLALCYVKLGKNAECISTCSNLLLNDMNNLKATFRRGQAHLNQGSIEMALVDIKRAHELSPEDETVKDAYDELLERVKRENISEEKVKEAEEKLKMEREAAETKRAQEQEEERQMESILQKSQMHTAASKKMQENPEMMQKAVDEMKKNPDMMKNMGKMLKEMPAEQLAAMAKSQPGMEGMPELTPDMAKMMADQFETMTPDQLDQMAEMAASMRGGAGEGGASSSSAVGVGAAAGGVPNMAGMDQAEMMKTMNEQMKNPEMRKMMNDMMKKITPEQMKTMAATTGMKMSDAQAEQMATQMKGLKDEDLEKMMKMAQTLQAAKAWFMANKYIVFALLILVIGMFLRWLGWA
eukprot:CAMPEP_0196580342 /NCGR_PEP_ID=MMETSP1081-20130531/28571_1 /TAXON_ID=36882 /ORGANISM="Pyramimonas amylifera, Strain CCMP720" /LENGTH=490 /DNA_ID=CAMNT_0041900185 /DNA_START=66 /DNA_END=1538 /DNA_ORIENTATION=+